ncbi:MAG: hypothetical protein K8S55_13675 [Phycisphaerae bacterium]|nr:hypothetical protein [Phycisphaerae bacterium]
MPYDNKRHHRRSIRLKGYDYSQAGAYFVTICTQDRECLFGEIVDGKMVLNDAGRMICRWYSELKNKYPDIRCDEFVCMPNHTHFVIINAGGNVRADRPGVRPGVRPDVQPDSMGETSKPSKTGEHAGSPLRAVVQWFKTMTTNEYIRGVKQHGWTPFPGKLWQRNYYDHIVRNEHEMNRIREYIANNPLKWEIDRDNPDAISGGMATPQEPPQ